jgi:hypothetical protein
MTSLLAIPLLRDESRKSILTPRIQIRWKSPVLEHSLANWTKLLIRDASAIVSQGKD